MLLDALKFFTELGQKAAAPVKLSIPDPRRAHYLSNGTACGFDLPAPPREHHVEILDDLIAMTRRFADLSGAEVGEHQPPAPSPVVWYNEFAAVLVIDDAGHRVERAMFALEHSEVFRSIVKLSERQWLAHKDFCRLLRTDLKPAIAAGDLLDKVKAIEFANGSIVKASSARGAESIGRSIKSEVARVEEIPEEVTLFARVWRNPSEDFQAQVRCAVDIDPDRGMLRLVPLPDAVTDEVERAVAHLGERLVQALGADVPCYRGAP